MSELQSPFFGVSESPSGLGLRLKAKREAHPIYWDDVMGLWVLLRRADILTALDDVETFSSSVYGVGPLASSPVSMDGERHEKRRRLYNRFFNPSAARHYEEHFVAPTTRRLMAQLAGRRRAELVDDVALKLPLEVFAALLGLPKEFIERADPWIQAINKWMVFPDAPGVADSGQEAWNEVSAHVRAVAAEEMQSPGQHLLGNLIRGLQAEGDVTLEQCEQLAVTLIHAGYFTTSWMLTAALAALLLHPAVLERVRDDRTKVMPAVDEAMRWSNPMVGFLRRVTRDTRVGDVVLPADSRVLLCAAAAHFDDAVYPRPEVFDIDRAPSHLGFGFGPHYCVGAPMARLVARTAVSMLLDSLPNLRLDPSEKLSFSYMARGAVMHGPNTLRVVFDGSEGDEKVSF